MRFHPKNLRLDEQGLSKVLGTLEAEVMDVVWEHGDASVRDVCDSLCEKKAYSFNTIMTIMNRLVGKRLLVKRRDDGGYVYKATVDKDVFAKEVTRSVVSSLITDGAMFHVSAFAEALQECTEDDIEALRKVIGKR